MWVGTNAWKHMTRAKHSLSCYRILATHFIKSTDFLKEFLAPITRDINMVGSSLIDQSMPKALVMKVRVQSISSNIQCQLLPLQRRPTLKPDSAVACPLTLFTCMCFNYVTKVSMVHAHGVVWDTMPVAFLITHLCSIHMIVTQPSCQHLKVVHLCIVMSACIWET